MADQPTYTADQIATAARELRQAAGADEERFTAEQVVSMLGEEIRLLRERGFNDAQISDLFNGFDICLSPEDLTRNAAPVRFQE